MNEQQIKQMLSTGRENFYQIVQSISEHVLSKEKFPVVANAIVTKAKAKKGFNTMDLFKYFYEEVGPLVEGTYYCPTKYNAQMLLKNVWQSSQFQMRVIDQIRKNYELIPTYESKVELTDEEKRKQRLKIQAEKMRQAKARKAAEKKALQDAKETRKVAEEKRVVDTKKLTPEQQAQLDLLKKLKI
jgi:hypothetical protein